VSDKVPEAFCALSANQMVAETVYSLYHAF
jgi:hypothetical protein